MAHLIRAGVFAARYRLTSAQHHATLIKLFVTFVVHEQRRYIVNGVVDGVDRVSSAYGGAVLETCLITGRNLTYGVSIVPGQAECLRRNSALMHAFGYHSHTHTLKHRATYGEKCGWRV